MLPESISKLLESYQQSTDNQEKINILTELLDDLTRHDRKLAKQLCEEGIVLALREDDKKALGNFYNTLGKQIYSTEDYNGALEYFFMALRMRRETDDHIGVGVMLNNIGSINNTLTNLDEAVKYHQQAIEIFEEHDYEKGLTMTYNNLGNVLGQQGDYKAALIQYDKSLEIKERLGDKKGLSIVYNNLGLTYMELDQYEKSLECQHNSLALKQEIDDTWGIANTLSNIVAVYERIADFDNAIEFGKQEVEAYRRVGDVKKMVGALIEVGLDYYNLGDYHSAMEYLEKAVNEAREDQHKDLGMAHKGIGDCYARDGVYDKAFAHYQKAFAHMDKMQADLLKNANQDMTRKIEANYEIRLKEQEKQMLEKSNEALEQFSYVVSHDLKEPLRTVNSFLGALDMKLSGKLTGEEKQLLNFALDGGRRMTSLIDEFLHFAKMTKNSDRFKIDQLSNIINVAESQLTLKLQETKGKIIKSFETVELYCDSGQLVQLFQNLFSNSLKFSRENVSPTIDIKVEEADEYYIISSADNGIGIDEKYTDSVFEIMQRVHAKTDYEGHGIGLSTCRKIVENHGGKIWLESAVGEGTIFYIQLPKLQLN